jgi:putative flippase GtrA
MNKAEQSVSLGNRSALIRFARFLGVGVIATGIQYLLLLMMVEALAWGAVSAATVSYALSGVFNYLMNYYFTFSSSAGHRQAIVRFAAVVVVGLGLTAALMYALVEWLSLHYLLSQLLTTAIVLVVNFAAHKLWTYKES